MGLFVWYFIILGVAFLNVSAPGNNTITTQLGDHEDPYDAFPTPPVTCKQCMGILNPDDVVVQTDQGGNLALWHAKCFICETCKELLVDLMYFFHKGKVFCGRHYAEIINIPRCYACDEVGTTTVLNILNADDDLPASRRVIIDLRTFSWYSSRSTLVPKESPTMFGTSVAFTATNHWVGNSTSLRILSLYAWTAIKSNMERYRSL